MAKHLKWLIPIFIILAAVSAALAQSGTNPYYFPLVFKSEPTPTPSTTPTPTSTPTKTPTPTKTKKPTVTSTPKPNVYIDIDNSVVAPQDDPLDEYIRIKNGTSKSVDMTGWLLRDEDPDNRFIFPDFTLGAGKSVKVWTKAGFNDSSNLYWNRTEQVWNDHNDCVYLRDEENVLIDSLCYHESLWSIFGLFP